MTNKNNTIKQKTPGERNKEVWVLKDSNGKIIDTFRQHQTAKNEKYRREKEYFGEELTIERDNSYIKNLKERLNEKKRKV